MANYKDKLQLTYFNVMIVLLSNRSDLKENSNNPSICLLGTEKSAEEFG